ncbi:MAG: type II secretion system F family protein [Pirellulales bacterium]|nr:type II secretion system F family protein [Pirellulales bacterium]
MLPTLTVCLACLVTAAAVGLASYSGSGYAREALDAVERDIADKLRRLRAPTRNLRPLLIAWLIVLAGALAGFWIVLDSPVFGVLTAVLLSCGPWYLLRRMAQRHRQRIEDQLADAMVMLSNAVRAGLSLAQSLEILAAQCPRPINAEFHQIVAEYKLGKPLDRTLREAKDRLRSENFALFAAALLASHESGGRLNETVERIAQSVIELQRLERKVQTETAQARKSAVYMALAPLIILVLYYFIEPDNTAKLFTTFIGQIFLTVALVLNIIAYLWARVILNPDI